MRSAWRMEGPIQRRLLVMLFLLCPVAAFACSVDTDYKHGSTCLKASGSVAGVCLEGIFPTTQGASNTGEAPPDPNGTNGKSCAFDTDCGVGSRCLKDYVSAGGVCMVGR